MGRKRLKKRKKTDPDYSEKVNFTHFFRSIKMNTLNMIRKQINKASALHDAQIHMTSYRGVKYECKQGTDETHGTFCYRGHTYSK